MLIEEQNGNFAKPVLPAVPSSEVYLEDCVTALKRFKDNHFDLAVVDPPYGINIAYDPSRRILTNRKTRKGLYSSLAKEQWDDRPNKEYFEELFRVSKNQIIWGGQFFTEHLPPKQCWIVWDKMNGNSSFSDCELAFTSFDLGLRICKCYTEKKDKIHICQKPIFLYEWLLKKFAKPNDLILDTHLGSGSSRIAAYKGGFDFVGFEIDKEYYEKQEKRFNDFKSQLRLF
jgi:site-specific DNA-methyltransferase (adenine-specific)